MEILLILISAVFVNNIVLTQFLGICPFLGVSNKISTSVGMGTAVIFVLTLATLVTYVVNNLVLIPLHLEFMQIVTFILLIAALVQLLEIIMKKTVPALYQALGIFLPLITTNCVVLGVSLLVIKKNYGLFSSLVYSLGTGVGFSLALVLLAGLREHMELMDVPEGMKGAPLVLLLAGLLSLAFMGFSGVV